MSDLISIIGKNELNELSMVLENIYSDSSFFIVFICAVNSIEILSLFILEQLKANADEVEQSL